MVSISNKDGVCECVREFVKDLIITTCRIAHGAVFFFFTEHRQTDRQR